MLLERIIAAINDINAQIDAQRIRNQAAIDSLQAKKAALVEAKRLITPELEQMVIALQRLGFITGL